LLLLQNEIKNKMFQKITVSMIRSKLFKGRGKH
jgi:hypothetical protein